MSAYEDTVRASLSQLEDDELFSRLRSGGLTEEAQSIAKELLAERGTDVPTPAEPPSSTPHPHDKRSKEPDSAFLSRCIRGAASLSDAFWVLGFAIWLGLGLPIGLVSALLRGTAVGIVVAILGALILFVAIVFRDVSIWRCAPNAKTVFWGVVARLWIGLSYGLTLIAALFR